MHVLTVTSRRVAPRPGVWEVLAQAEAPPGPRAPPLAHAHPGLVKPCSHFADGRPRVPCRWGQWLAWWRPERWTEFTTGTEAVGGGVGVLGRTPRTPPPGQWLLLKDPAFCESD